LQEFNAEAHPGTSYFNSVQNLAKSSLALERQRLLPDLNVSVFQGTNNGLNARNYNGFQVGIALPIWFGTNKSKINAAKIETMIIADEYENYKIKLQSQYDGLLSDLKRFEEMVHYYETTGKSLAKELTITATKSFQNGEINFLQYVQLIESAKNIEINYLQNLNKYNTTVLELNHLTMKYP